MIDGKLQNRESEDLLVNVFELLESFEQEVVHVGTVVADVDEDLPWLKHFVNKFKILESISILENIERSKL